MINPIRISGLEEFRRDIRQLDGDLPKVIRLAANEAADIIVRDARGRIPTRTGRLAGSLRTASTQTSVAVKLGSKKLAYAGWIEFGGARRGRGGGIAQRPFIKSGRAIYPSLARNGELVEEHLLLSLIRIAGQAGVQVDR